MTGTLLVLSELPTGLAHPGCPSETELRGIISCGSGTQPAVLWPEIWEIWAFSFPFTSGTHGPDFPPGSGHSTTPSSPSCVSASNYFESWLLVSESLQIIILSHDIYFRNFDNAQWYQSTHMRQSWQPEPAMQCTEPIAAENGQRFWVVGALLGSHNHCQRDNLVLLSYLRTYQQS